MKTPAGCSTLSRILRTSAISRSAAALISCIWNKCVTRSIARAPRFCWPTTKSPRSTPARRLGQISSKKEDRTMDAPREKQKIPGYDFGTDKVAKSPITMQEWEELKKSALFSEEDVIYLRLSEDVLADQVDELLQTWRGIIFDHPHLRAYDEDPKTHQVDTDYAQAVAKRFGQWVLDTARAKYDQAWLDYQYEIGLRHHRSKKNKTDHGH